MLTSTKSGAPEKDRNASVGAAEVMGRVVQHDQTWAKLGPTTRAGMASCIGSDMSIVGKIDCDGPAQVFGRIEGEVRASDLQISDGAQVEGCRTVARSRVTFFIRRCRSTRTLSLKDRRGELRIQRTYRRVSTPKARRKALRKKRWPRRRSRPSTPSWRMRRSSRTCILGVAQRLRHPGGCSPRCRHAGRLDRIAP